MNKYFLLLSFIFFLHYSFAQRPGGQAGGGMAGSTGGAGTISGKVIDDKSGVGMEYVSIALYSLRDSAIVGGVISSTSGSFIISDIKFGRYLLIANFMGYKRDTIKDIKVNPQKVNTVLDPIRMKALSTELSEVEVVATKTFVEYKIDRKVVNIGSDIGSNGGSAVQALENVPSVSVDIDGNVSLRGSTNFTVLIDGKPSPLSGTEALEQIPVGSIKDIEIITNPSAKFDPDGMSGIINVKMKKNAQKGINGQIELSAGTHDNYGLNAMFSYRSPRFNVYAGGDYSQRQHPGSGNSILETYFGDTTFYRNTISDRLRGRLGFNIKTGADFFYNDKNTFSFEVRASQGKPMDKSTSTTMDYYVPAINSIYRASTSAETGSRPNYSGNILWEHKYDEKGQKFIAQMDYTTSSSESIEILRDYYSDANFNPTANDYFGSKSIESDNNWNFLGKIDYTKPFKGDNKLELGMQVRLNRNNAKYDYNFLDTSFNQSPASGDWVYDPLYSSTMEFDEDIYSIYSTYGGTIKSFGYLLGLRGELTDRSIASRVTTTPFTSNQFDIFPTVHFSKKLKFEQQLLLSYSRRIQRPNGWQLDPFPAYMSSTSIRIGNPLLKPEYSSNIELSYQKNIKTSYFSIEAYYRSTLNKITRLRAIDTTMMSYMTFDNLDKDVASGMEAMANLTLTKWLNWNVSGSVYYYHIFGNEASKTEDRSSVNYTIKTNIGIKFLQNGRFQITGSYDGPSVTAQGNIKAMYAVNSSVRYDFFAKKLALTFSVRDIFNTMHHKMESYGENYLAIDDYVRAGRVLNLTATYRINNYKPDNRRQGMGGMEGEGGGDF